MYKQDEIRLESLLRVSLKPSRWKHTLRCREMAVRLAQKHQCSPERVSLAALCHDAFRDFSPAQWVFLAKDYGLRVDPVEKQAPVLLHGPLAAAYLEQTCSTFDAEMLEAVRYHTGGNRIFCDLGKILFLADGMEPGRTFPERQRIEQLAFQNLDEACYQMLESQLSFLNMHKLICHPDSQIWFNELILKRKNGVSI